MAVGKEVQEKMLTYRILEARLDGLVKQRDMIANKIWEIETTLQSIAEISKSKEEILFPIGSEAYTFGRAMDKDKLIVEIGAGIALEKNIEEGKETLNRRKTELENAMKDIQEDVAEISNNIEMLAADIQQSPDYEQAG